MRFFRDGLEVQAKSRRVVVRDGHVCEVFEREGDGPLWFLTIEGTAFCAHGESFHDALIAAKEKQNPGAAKSDALDRVQESGHVTLKDFCLVTGACRAGATAWAKQEGLSLTAKLTVKDALKRLEKSASREWGTRLREELGGECGRYN
jgi:hypothetical protein